MIRIVVLRSLVGATCVLASLFDPVMADEPTDIARVNAFWKALASADTDAMKSFYAPKVELKAGSELLKPEWGLSEDADRSKNLLVNRDNLLQGYERMIGRIGKEKWSQVFTRIGKDKIHVSTAAREDQPLAGVKRGDTILKVSTGAGADTLYFILRRDKEGHLLVHLEASDY